MARREPIICRFDGKDHTFVCLSDSAQAELRRQNVKRCDAPAVGQGIRYTCVAN